MSFAQPPTDLEEISSRLPKDITKTTVADLIGKVDYDDSTVTRRFIRENNAYKLMPYQIERMKDQEDKLKSISEQENKTREFISTTNIFYNLSLKELGENLSKTWVDIINELVNFSQFENKDFKTLINIFLEQDRLIYVGITVIFVALMLYIISVTS